MRAAIYEGQLFKAQSEHSGAVRTSSSVSRTRRGGADLTFRSVALLLSGLGMHLRLSSSRLCPPSSFATRYGGLPPPIRPPL